MKLKKDLIMFLVIIATVSSLSDLFSQNIPSKPSRQSSMEAFSKGNFDQAYKEFRALLLVYSKDPLYKYYSGVCLVRLNREPAEAESLLKQAIQSAAVIKTLPSDAMFFLGRAQQMAGNFSDAVDSYNFYTKQAGKKAAREVNVPDYIRQCNEKQGSIAVTDVKPAAIVKNEMTDSGNVKNQTILKNPDIKPVRKDSTIKMNLPVGFEKILDEALESQIKADSLTTVIAVQKKQLETLPVSQQKELQGKIAGNEMAAASFQKAADKKYSEAQAAMNPLQPQPAAAKETVKQPDIIAANSDIKSVGNKDNITTGKLPDSGKIVAIAAVKPVEIFGVFEILPGPGTDSKEKIIFDPEVPEGLIYRIQIAVFRNPVPLSYFKGITPVYGFRVPGTDKTNYYVGMFRRSADATKALGEVRSKGFRDAFVVSLSGNKPVSADRAVVLEREWGSKPLITIMPSGSQTQKDTIPPALVFKVQVIKLLKPAKDDVVDGIRKMAGNRGLDIKTLDDGNIAYLIGKFVTFESASEYADLLVRNGYREAKVVAWLGNKEVTLETAKQLFDNME